MDRRRLMTGGLLAALFFLANLGSARAHPHGWIDLRVTVIFNDAGEVTGLRQSWLFDEGYSAFVTDGDSSPEALLAVSRENMENLRDFDYFTLVKSGGGKVGYHAVTDLKARLVDKRLETSFVLHLDRPVSPALHGLTYAVFDPTYYIEMLHMKTDDAIRLDNAPAGCSHSVKQPEPPTDLIAAMAALGKDESAGTEVGIDFAQQVTVTCPK